MEEVIIELDWCTLTLHSSLTCCRGIAFSFTNKCDGTGNELAPDKRTTHHVEIDNYQAYELALGILKAVDVRDNRGSS